MVEEVSEPPCRWSTVSPGVEEGGRHLNLCQDCRGMVLQVRHNHTGEG